VAAHGRERLYEGEIRVRSSGRDVPGSSDKVKREEEMAIGWKLWKQLIHLLIGLFIYGLFT
jgi:hypothetical protein